MPHVRDDVRSHRNRWNHWSRWRHTGRLQPGAQLGAAPVQRVASPSAFAGGAHKNKTNEWGSGVSAPQPHVGKGLPDQTALPSIVSGDERAPHYHWHQDTHHHHYYAAAQAQDMRQLALSALPALPALPPGQPALSRSGGCLVTFLVLLGAFLTFMVLLMGLALAGQILTLR